MNTYAKVHPDSLPSRRQLEALRVVYKLKIRLGRFPTQREVSEAMGLSENGAQSHLKALEKLGLLTEPEIVRVQDLTSAGLKWVR